MVTGYDAELADYRVGYAARYENEGQAEDRTAAVAARAGWAMRGGNRYMDGSPRDGRAVAEASRPGAGREAWLKSCRTIVADLQQRNREYLAARAHDLGRELEAGAG